MKFHHHPDSKIIMRAGEALYIRSLAEFLVDIATLEASEYTGLPGARNERCYEPGVKHFLANRDTQFPQALPWAPGDEYLSRINEFVAVPE